MAQDDRRSRCEPLRALLARRSRSALASGALRPIETESLFLEEAGVRFLVRVVSSLARKDRDRRGRAGATAPGGRPANPFLPYEKEMLVAELSDSHVALLNKFNVIDGHLLIVTRSFEDQERLLGPSDFEALWTCMSELGGLGFYNGGTLASASQPHKHLQLVPLPLAEEGPAVPIEPLLAAGGSGLPFAHAFAPLEPALDARPRVAAARAQALYLALLGSLGLHPVELEGELRQPAPYNLLLTRRWMLVVPRRKEHFASVSINALGFAGSLFLRDREELRRVRERGPLAVLREVAGAADPTGRSPG